MNLSSAQTLDAVSVLLISLQRICRNLSHLLNSLDADVDSFEHLLTQLTTSMHESPSTSSLEYEQEMEDFYEKLCDEQLEPKVAPRVTTL
ncbi:unnamed protein product [Adineta ricciae]|uniref:Uncharacterized protein n=1 Tax=Adineta ricciae TaxID=249248 RepID=A0A814BWL9_ADIRI|nr:unnamed protein product [Adineta ricciae]